MEVIRNHEPADNFLRQVRELADQHGIVLIFDECTSGFRETFGGIHKKFGVEPDVATFGNGQRLRDNSSGWLPRCHEGGRK